jgi:hypothetical protein
MARGPVIGAALASLTAGFVIGLVIAWGLWPVQFAEADPVDLRAAYKQDYVRMISAAYQVNGNLALAQVRLIQLGYGNAVPVINGLVTRDRQTGGVSRSTTALVSLAAALSAPQAAPKVATAPPTRSAVTPAAMATLPVPTFALVERTPLGCLDSSGAILVYVRDARGKDLPNIAVEIRWALGDETLYTGLKPERGVGYADLATAPGTYTVTILNASSPAVTGLIVGSPPVDCRSDRGVTPRGWKLVFQQQ